MSTPHILNCIAYSIVRCLDMLSNRMVQSTIWKISITSELHTIFIVSFTSLKATEIKVWKLRNMWNCLSWRAATSLLLIRRKIFLIPTLRFGLTIFEKLLNVRPLLNKFITQNTYQNIQFKHAFSNPNFPKPRG